MISPTAVYWLSFSLLLYVTLSDLSLQRHAVASATVELQAQPMMPQSDLASDVDRRRFMFGRRSADNTAADWLSGQAIRSAATRRRFKFGKKWSGPSSAMEKRKRPLFGKRWSDVKRMFKFGKRK